MKTIIIPTNCGAACIEQLNNILHFYSNEQVKCIFLQVRAMPDNYNDMMTLNKYSRKSSHFEESFTHAVNLLMQQHAGRLTVTTDYLYGDSAVVFRNYIKHHNADLVVYDKKDWENSDSRLNIFRMVRRCGAELMYVSKENPVAAREIVVNNWQRKNAPDSVMYKYNAVDQQLDDILNSNKIVSKKMSNVSRYFLNESILDKMLMQSDCSLLLLKK